MDFRELSYVLAIARYQNITKAAEALYVGQPTLSKFLISLENNLGLKLFRRSGNKYLLTYAGERYTRQAAEIMRLKNELDVELSDILRRDVGTLNVAFANMRCTYMLPCALPEFEKLHPNVRVNVFEGNSDENDLRVLDGSVELSFYSKPAIPNPQISYESLGEEELLVITKKNHSIGRFAEPNPYSIYPRIDLKVLEKERVILTRPEQRTRQIMDNYLQEKGVHFENVMYTGNLPAIMELVAQGYGVSFMFEPHLRHRLGTVPIDLYSFGNPRMVTDFVAATRKGAYLSTYARDFIEIARKIHAQP
ncbi:MAG: LysR family transcriptional regulator [Lachnospiraceae bacterium]|nr:LysR family transcriptional regulator [Lachnospiraceae bacterium]